MNLWRPQETSRKTRGKRWTGTLPSTDVSVRSLHPARSVSYRAGTTLNRRLALLLPTMLVCLGAGNHWGFHCLQAFLAMIRPEHRHADTVRGVSSLSTLTSQAHQQPCQDSKTNNQRLSDGPGFWGTRLGD